MHVLPKERDDGNEGAAHPNGSENDAQFHQQVATHAIEHSNGFWRVTFVLYASRTVEHD